MPSNPLTPEEIIAYGKRQNYPAGRFNATHPTNPGKFGWYDLESYLTTLGYTTGVGSASWISLVTGFKTINETPTIIISGEVYEYTFESTPNDVVYYRYIASDGSEDSFYETFLAGTLGGLIVSKQINV